MAGSGWVKLYRKIQDSDMYKNLNSIQRDVMINCLLLANHEERTWEWRGKLFKAKPGQFVTSLSNLKEVCAPDLSIQNIRTALRKLKKWGFLDEESTQTGRLITIVNWDRYQKNDGNFNNQTNKELTKDMERYGGDNSGPDNKTNKHINKELTNSQQSTNKELTTNKNVKNVDNYKNDKNIKKINTLSGKPVSRIPYKEIVDHLNLKIGSRYKHTTKKTRELIKARWNEGFREEDFFTVIDKKCMEWINCDMKIYLRPETLFGSKFESYLNQLSVKPRGQSKQEAKDEMLRKLYQEALEEERKGGSDEEDRLD